MEEDFEQLVRVVLGTVDKNKFNIAIGFFQEYTTSEADTSDKRFCRLKLHFKDIDSNDIDLVKVPIAYIGNQLIGLDYKLTHGDEMLVLFSDRSLEQWKDKNGTEPQKLENPVKDSINHAFAIPISTHHYINDFVDQKLDILNILDRLLGTLLGDNGPLDLAGTASTGTFSQTPVINELTALRNAITPNLN